jgi:hypothetical protein
LLCGLTDGGNGDTGLLEEGRRNASFLFEKREQEVFHVHTLVTPAHRVGGSRLEGFLKFDGHPVHIHEVPR